MSDTATKSRAETRPRVLVVDDHQLVRQALRNALEEVGMRVVSEAADGEEGVRLADQLRPDVIVMDVTMPVLDGVEAARRIHDAQPAVRIVMLTMHDEQALLADAIEAGAVAYLTKDCSMQEVVETVELTASGEVLLSPELAARMLGELRGERGMAPPEPAAMAEPEPEGPDSPLTRREDEILQLVADGRSTAEIARELFISAKTVKNHLASIYAKLDARDRTQAVLSGVRMGIVQLR